MSQQLPLPISPMLQVEVGPRSPARKCASSPVPEGLNTNQANDEEEHVAHTVSVDENAPEQDISLEAYALAIEESPVSSLTSSTSTSSW
jgi:hypothetical protein